MQAEKLTRNGDFVRAYKKGKAFVHPYIVLYVNKNRVGVTRVGITASKKIGGAVQRNRARRIIRHALAEVMPENAGSVDIVVVARGKTPYLKTTHIVQALQKCFKNAKLPVKTITAGEQ